MVVGDNHKETFLPSTHRLRRFLSIRAFTVLSFALVAEVSTFEGPKHTD